VLLEVFSGTSTQESQFLLDALPTRFLDRVERWRRIVLESLSLNDRKTIVAVRNGDIVGFVGVHPGFQGQGISNLLYLRALETAKKMGFTRLFGFSTTERVLSHNEKLARKVKSHHFIL
jgi:GNAT superfamily N-acetyltransferase